MSCEKQFYLRIKNWSTPLLVCLCTSLMVFFHGWNLSSFFICVISIFVNYISKIKWLTNDSIVWGSNELLSLYEGHWHANSLNASRSGLHHVCNSNWNLVLWRLNFDLSIGTLHAILN
jgi:hypothetical protein